MLRRLADSSLVKGKRVGIDARALEDNAGSFLWELTEASGIRAPSGAEVARFERKRPSKGPDEG